jgi:hypothetical protein
MAPPHWRILKKCPADISKSYWIQGLKCRWAVGGGGVKGPRSNNMPRAPRNVNPALSMSVRQRNSEISNARKVLSYDQTIYGYENKHNIWRLYFPVEAKIKVIQHAWM